MLAARWSGEKRARMMPSRDTTDAGQEIVKVSLGARSYEIRIAAGLLSDVGPALAGLGFDGKAAVVTDRAVARHYAAPAMRSLKRAGFTAEQIVLPSGERTKTLKSVETILDRLVRARFERGSVVVALGGGVVGDVAGFAASVYLRGIPFIQVPTTLVSQVDSSVGGKTGVNHPSGKNLIGAFHQPHVVLIDPGTLRTLPRREWIAGLAEVIKYGVIADERFFGYLETHMDRIVEMERGPVTRVIARSCEIKAEVVSQDEREAGLRRILNYGHTIGHALEALGRYRALIHGEAVAIGMVQEADLARSLGLCDPGVVSRQRELVRRARLSDALPRVSCKALWRAMLLDKKVVGGQVHCVLPERIGRVVVQAVGESSFTAWWRERAKEDRRASPRGKTR